VTKLSLKVKNLETPFGVFLYFYFDFLVIINLTKENFIILIDIKYCLKTKVVGACVWDTPHLWFGTNGVFFLFSLFYLSSSIYMPNLLDFQSNP
jgi:hypothetical protein